MFPGSKGGRCVGLTTLPPSCANCLEIWEPQHPGNLRACPRLQWDCFTFTLHITVWAELQYTVECQVSLLLIKYYIFFTNVKTPSLKKLWVNVVFQLATRTFDIATNLKNNRKRLGKLGQHYVNQPYRFFKFFLVLNKTIFPCILQSTAKCQRGRLEITSLML